MILRPISVPPVNSAWSKPWASRSWVVEASPSTTRMASESRYSGTRRAITADVAGASSDGLITAALPAATAATSGAMHR